MEDTKIIPIISFSEPKTIWKFWPQVRFDAIAVNYFSLRRNRLLYKEALLKGIRDAFGFNGKIFALLIGENYELDTASVEAIAGDLELMKFDASSTLDDYTYLDDFRNHRFDRIHVLLDRARQIKALSKITQVAIVKGVSCSEIRFCVQRLYQAGFRHVIFPCSELVKERRFGEISEFLRIANKLGVWKALAGANSPQVIKKFDADAFFVNWSYRATLGDAFSLDGVKKLDSPYELRCDHESCQSLIKSHSDPHLILARHNIQTFLELNLKMRGEADGWRNSI
ncbi:MAG: hypothetical protein QXP38_04730 [Nitrososphaerota archaeon]